MDIERGNRQPQEIVGLRETVPVDDLTAFFSRAFSRTMDALASRGVDPVGPPVALYGEMSGASVEVTAGFPVTVGAAPSEDVIADMLPGGPTVETVHRGSYDDMSRTYEALMTQLAQEGVTTGTPMWEEYLVGPDSGRDASEWVTRIVFPVR